MHISILEGTISFQNVHSKFELHKKNVFILFYYLISMLNVINSCLDKRYTL